MEDYFLEKEFTKIEMSKYTRIIDIIFEEHDEYSKKWISGLTLRQFDLKKTYVCDIFIKNKMSLDEDFKNYMESYLRNLNYLLKLRT